MSRPTLPRRLRVVAISATLVALLAAPLAQTAAVTLVRDPERLSTSLAGWGWHTSATVAQISAFTATGYRIIDLEVTDSATPKFSVAYVQNTGAYARSWWWYYGLTSTQVNSYLSTNNARLIDVEPYSTASGIRYAVVMVANTGAAAKTWWWRTGYSVAQISSFASANGARPVDIDRIPGASTFTVIFIKNTGVDASGWWHLYGATTTQINSLISSQNARLIDLERIPGQTTYDALLIPAGSGNWWWYYGQSASALEAKAAQLGARIVKLEPYLSGLTTYYAAVLVNDVNAETTRIRNLVSNGMGSSRWGFYVKKVGGPVQINLNEHTVFEPASMIKVVHHLTAMRSIMNTSETTGTDVTWYVDPANPARYPGDFDYKDDKDRCAYTDAGAAITTMPYVDNLGGVILKQMMEQSDNRATDAVVNRYGFAAINATADLVGMTKTELYHRIGCDRDSPPAGYHANELTLRDAALLYEKVENGTMLDTSTYRSLFYSYMNDGVVGGDLATMIGSEAALAGLTSSEISAFKAATTSASKGGSYGLCPDSGSCDPSSRQIRTVGGIIWVPFKNGLGVIVPTAYTYGRFFDVTVNCSFASVKAGTCAAYNTVAAANNTIAVEMFRAIIKQAVTTW